MIKPHEETWVQLGGPRVAIRALGKDGGTYSGAYVGALEDPERTRLATQAPAMARRLLKRQSECGCKTERNGCCPDCFADREILRAAGVLNE